jgi:hypothetical protein
MKGFALSANPCPEVVFGSTWQKVLQIGIIHVFAHGGHDGGDGGQCSPHRAMALVPLVQGCIVGRKVIEGHGLPSDQVKQRVRVAELPLFAHGLQHRLRTLLARKDILGQHRWRRHGHDLPSVASCSLHVGRPGPMESLPSLQSTRTQGFNEEYP